mmetsp:Transcript_36758/g.105042  ORF Transcript_36758/g.105042 Transcript_36758/m.105042 type:complete len:226 (+) Transcript_36758:1328-2005(+)
MAVPVVPCSSFSRFTTRNSVHALPEALASTTTSPRAFTTGPDSSGPRSLPSGASRTGAAASFSRSLSFSALPTSSPSSASSLLMVSSCSLCSCSSSCLRDSSLRRISLTPSMRTLACSTCLSASSRIRSACIPHLGSSISSASSISFLISSKSSGVAYLTFPMTFLTTRAEDCSSRRRSSSLRSASRRCSSWICCALAASICWRFLASSCCCWRTRSCMSYWLPI